MTIQNPKTLEWDPAVVLEVKGVPRSYMVTTPNGKELCRNRSQIRQILQVPPKHVKFDLRRNEVYCFHPRTDRISPDPQPSQSIPRNSPTPKAMQGEDQPVKGADQPVSTPAGAAQSQTASPNPVGAARAVSPTPVADRPVNSAPPAEDHYVTSSGRVVRAPSRMDA